MPGARQGAEGADIRAAG